MFGNVSYSIKSVFRGTGTVIFNGSKLYEFDEIVKTSAEDNTLKMVTEYGTFEVKDGDTYVITCDIPKNETGKDRYFALRIDPKNRISDASVIHRYHYYIDICFHQHS